MESNAMRIKPVRASLRGRPLLRSSGFDIREGAATEGCPYMIWR